MKQRIINILQFFNKYLLSIVGFLLIAGICGVIFFFESFSTHLDPSLSDKIGLAGLVFGFFTLIYATIQLYNYLEEKRLKDRPYIYFDIEIPKHSICNFVMINMGGSPAIDIHIEFEPNVIYHGEKKINDLPALKKFSFLAPNKKISFFFGTFMEDKVKQAFTITKKYKDIHGNEYKETQILDPRELLDRLNINEKGIDDIADELKDIAKTLKNTEKKQESIDKTLKGGLIIRNLSTVNLKNSKEGLNTIVNLFENKSPYEFQIRPFLYDFESLVFLTRNLILKEGVNDQNRKLVEELNTILTEIETLTLGKDLEPQIQTIVNEAKKVIS